jgi:hypothetical protein
MIEDMNDAPIVQIAITRQQNGAWKVALFSERACVENFSGVESRSRVLEMVEKHLKKLAAPCKADVTAP